MNYPTRLIGYARVSSTSQELRSQIQALVEHGVERNLIFTDKASGAKANRPGLEKCLETLQPGDVLVVCRLDRLGRSLRHLVDLVDQLEQRQVGLRSLSDGIIDTTSAGGRLIFGIFSALAEFERELIRERTKSGLEAARARGRKGGRPGYTPDDPRVIVARSLYQDGPRNFRNSRHPPDQEQGDALPATPCGWCSTWEIGLRGNPTIPEFRLRTSDRLTSAIFVHADDKDTKFINCRICPFWHVVCWVI